MDIVTLEEATDKERPDTVVITILSDAEMVRRELMRVLGNVRVLVLEDMVYEVE